MRWLILGFVIYVLYRLWLPLKSLLVINENYKQSKRKSSISKKVGKMDILDADFEDK
tara:strand:+ start:40267 stop:40437 length:171 start_codon:yes stop_codon:yes gene_type:complete